MAYDSTIAMATLKARMDRAGVACPAALESYWQNRLVAASQKLEGKGITLTNSIEDSMLVGDYAAETIINRDKPGGLPEWLRLDIRERWIKERRNAD